MHSATIVEGQSDCRKILNCTWNVIRKTCEIIVTMSAMELTDSEIESASSRAAQELGYPAMKPA